MNLVALLVLAQTIPIDLRIETPWQLCEPVLLATIDGKPLPPPPAVLTMYREPVYIHLQSTCRVGILWRSACDVGLATTFPEAGVAGPTETTIEVVSNIRSPGGVTLSCRITWAPCPQSDLDRDCRVDWEDLVMLDVARAVNTLEVFAWMQREWSGL